jgi:hypothetical protein
MTKTLVERLEEQGRVGICGVPDDFEWVSYAQAAAEITRLASRIEELERALRLISGQSPIPSNSPDKTHEHYLRMVLIDLARQALSDKG